MRKGDLLFSIFVLSFIFICIIALSKVYIKQNDLLYELEYMRHRTFILESKISQLYNELYNIRKEYENDNINTLCNITDIIFVNRITAFTDSGNLMASGIYPYKGAVALSRDLYEKYKFNECLVFVKENNMYKCIGLFKVLDKMNKRYNLSVDIYLEDKSECVSFGVKEGFIILRNNILE